MDKCIAGRGVKLLTGLVNLCPGLETEVCTCYKVLLLCALMQLDVSAVLDAISQQGIAEGIQILERSVHLMYALTLYVHAL